MEDSASGRMNGVDSERNERYRDRKISNIGNYNISKYETSLKKNGAKYKKSRNVEKYGRKEK